MLSSIFMALKRVSLCGITVVSDTSHSRSRSPSPLVPLPTSGTVGFANCHLIRHIRGCVDTEPHILFFHIYFKIQFLRLSVVLIFSCFVNAVMDIGILFFVIAG